VLIFLVYRIQKKIAKFQASQETLETAETKKQNSQI